MSYSLAYSRSNQEWQVRDHQSGNVVSQYPTREGALGDVQLRNGRDYDALEALAESSLIPEITNEIVDGIEPYIREIAREGMETAEDLVSAMQKRKALGASELNRLTDEFIRDYRSEWSRSISDSTRGAIRDTLRRGRRNGWAIEDVISTVKRQGFSPSRAQTIAVTETTEVYGQAAVSHYSGMGLQQWRWHAVADFAVDLICANKNGQKFPVSQIFQPAHPNCRCFASPVPLPDGAQPQGHYDEVFTEPTQGNLMQALSERRAYSQTDDFLSLDGGGPLTEAMEESVDIYKGTGYRSINGKLRGRPDAPDIQPGDGQPVNTHIANMDAAFDAQPGLQRNVNLYRDPGEEFWDAVGPMDESIIGAEVVDDGFVSTSGSKLFSSGWSGEGSPTMHIRAPAGQRALIPGRTKGHEAFGDGELEVMLPRGTKFRVADIDPENNTVIMDIVPEGG